MYCQITHSVVWQFIISKKNNFMYSLPIRNFTVFFIYILFAIFLHGCQSRGKDHVMKEIRTQYPNASSKVVYRSNLNMLNYENDEDFEKLIFDIEKITILKVDKSEYNVKKGYEDQIKETLIEQEYIELINIKHKGYRANILGKEANGELEAYFVIINNEDTFIVLDINGSIPLQNINTLLENVHYLENFNF